MYVWKIATLIFFKLVFDFLGFQTEPNRNRIWFPIWFIEFEFDLVQVSNQTKKNFKTRNTIRRNQKSRKPNPLSPLNTNISRCLTPQLLLFYLVSFTNVVNRTKNHIIFYLKPSYFNRRTIINPRVQVGYLSPLTISIDAANWTKKFP